MSMYLPNTDLRPTGDEAAEFVDASDAESPSMVEPLGVSARPGAGSSGPLRDATCAIRLPAQDLDRARLFYAEKLGLEPSETRPGGLRYVCGETSFVVFESSGRASGDHTQMGFYVPDVDAAVAEMRTRGVVFDDAGIVDIDGNYPSTGATGERAAWFHDSEGNLIGLGQLVFEPTG
jgi:catechol 2,3-dioxygenase-like lactoylglutathione lyase family enzyme